MEGLGRLAHGAYRPVDDRAGTAEGEFLLGTMLEERQDVGAAEQAYRRADLLGHAAAACNLGTLLEGRRQFGAAEEAYRRADKRGDANGAFNLGVMLEEGGDLRAAESAYGRADRRGPRPRRQARVAAPRRYSATRTPAHRSPAHRVPAHRSPTDPTAGSRPRRHPRPHHRQRTHHRQHQRHDGRGHRLQRDGERRRITAVKKAEFLPIRVGVAVRPCGSV
jgi:tetratricopeptide (TPR) repeat protein